MLNTMVKLRIELLDGFSEHSEIYGASNLNLPLIRRSRDPMSSFERSDFSRSPISRLLICSSILSTSISEEDLNKQVRCIWQLQKYTGIEIKKDGR